MELNRKELISILKILSPGLASKAIVNHSDRFCFEVDTIRTYNDEMNIVFPLETGIEGAIPSKEFLQLLEKMNDEVIGIEASDDVIKVSGGKIKTKLKIDSEVKLPKVDFKIKRWEALPSDFIEAIKFCLISVGKDQTKPELTCVHIIEDRVEACNAIAATRKMMDAKIEEFLLPKEFVKPLSVFNPTDYYLKDNWIHFTNETKAVFSCRIIEDEFPNNTKYFEVEGTEVDFPIDFSKVIERSMTILDDEEKNEGSILLQISNNNVICNSLGFRGKISQRSKVRYKGPDVGFYVNPIMFLSILAHLKSCIISDEVLLFKGSDFDYVVSFVPEEEVNESKKSRKRKK